jgi:hypothetical protein
MTTHHDVARQLQLKMSQLRGQIAEESEEAADQTRLALDWKHQIASNPLIAAAVAFAIGYWLIPRWRSSAVADPPVEVRLPPREQARPSVPRSRIWKTLALAAGSILIRALVSGAVSKAIAGFETFRDQRSTEDQGSVSKHNSRPIKTGKPNAH